MQHTHTYTHTHTLTYFVGHSHEMTAAATANRQSNQKMRLCFTQWELNTCLSYTEVCSSALLTLHKIGSYKIHDLL